MSDILIRSARVLTMSGQGPARGAAGMNDLGVIPRAEVLIRNGLIESVTSSTAGTPPTGARVIEANGRVLMPGFVDCHTHACWAGNRLDEWDAKRRGVSYLDILKSGGGIMSTVRAVRAAAERQLKELLLERLALMLREGTTTIEVKSGYGLSTEAELKMLRAIADAAAEFPGTIAATALLGHALDPDVPADRFIKTTIEETLPAVHAEFPEITVDAFCENGAWPLDACTRLFDRASALGHRFRVHTDQFGALGMTEWAISNHARSVDHLEATPPELLQQVASSRTFGVMLPATGFHLMPRPARAAGAPATLIAGRGAPVFADGRAFVDAGGALAIATNYNPGSAPCPSMPMAIALAVRMLGLTPAEAITASTRNAAALLTLGDRGRIEAGARADLVLSRHTDERMLAYEFGSRAVEAVVCGGVLVGGRSAADQRSASGRR